MLTPRYVLASFIALFALSGIGVASLKRDSERIAVSLLIVFLAIVQAHVSNPWDKPEVQWRECDRVRAIEGGIRRTYRGSTLIRVQRGPLLRCSKLPLYIGWTGTPMWSAAYGDHR